MAEKSILIVEDSDVQRMIIASSLKSSGFRVIQANSGNRAIEIMREIKPDLILLDIEMPGMNGFETLKKIRENYRYKYLPVLFLTIVDEKTKVVEGLDIGADDYIVKPFNRQELVSRVNAALRRSERLNRVWGDIEGDLSNMNLSDFMESIESNSKTAEIRIPESDAGIFFEYGHLVHVGLGEVTGDKALARIFLRNKGLFLIRFNELPADIPKRPRSLFKALRGALAILEFDEDDKIRNHANREKVKRQIKRALLRSESRIGADGIMSGYLHDVEIGNLMQGMKHDSKTAVIRLEDIDGAVYFKEGNLFHVRLGHVTGDGALARIILLNRGAFTVRYGRLPDIIPGASQPLMPSLMKAAAEADEVRDSIKQVGAEETLLDYDPDLPEFSGLKDSGIYPPVQLINLLVLMKNDLKENLETIKSAVQNGNARILPATGRD